MELLFEQAAATTAELLDFGHAAGGLSIEYGPEGAELDVLDGDSRADACEDGTLRHRPWAAHGTARDADEAALGLNISLFASKLELRPSAQHNGSDLLGTALVDAIATELGPPLDVWLGLQISVFADPGTHATSLNIS